MRRMLTLASARPFIAVLGAALALCGLVVIASTLGPAAWSQTNVAPVHAVTYLDVAASAVDQGVALVKSYRDASRRDGANLEFTVLQETSRRNRFVIVEAWKDQATFEGHMKGAVTASFLDALKPIRISPPDRHMVQDFATGPARGTPAGGALYTVEHVDFSPQFGAVGESWVKALAEASRKEAGAVRFDAYQQPRPRVNHYEVVAVWVDERAFEAHETAAHTRQFRTTSARPGRANLYDIRQYKTP